MLQRTSCHCNFLALAMLQRIGLPDTGSGSGSVARLAGEGGTAMWVKITSEWLAVALYVWTLVAHKVFPDREFF